MRWRDFDELPALPNDFFVMARRVHFIGIGGIGMSALALALLARGHRVSGSDAHESPLLCTLREAGAVVVTGHQAANLQLLEATAECTIWGSAITPDNAERREAARLNIPQWHRAQLLAYFVNHARHSVAVSGTHGKSTTSAMIAHILAACGRNPTAILGAVYPPFGSNARLGDPDLVVVEADESDGSFTLSKPSIAVVTNVEPEHLENYENSEDELWRAFGVFVAQARGAAVLNADEAAVWNRLAGKAVEAHACGESEAARAAGALQLPSLRVGAPGRHNRHNALAAIGAAALLGVEPQEAARALEDFTGVARRFERKGEANGVLIYDDYAHHPTEIESTLHAAREYFERPLVAIFQPHRYTRTQQMGAELGHALRFADRVIVTELYSAFETPIAGISGRIVFDGLRAAAPALPAHFATNLEEARRMARTMIQPGDAVLTMGAGDISRLGAQLLADLEDLASQSTT